MTFRQHKINPLLFMIPALIALIFVPKAFAWTPCTVCVQDNPYATAHIQVTTPLDPDMVIGTVFYQKVAVNGKVVIDATTTDPQGYREYKVTRDDYMNGEMLTYDAEYPAGDYVVEAWTAKKGAKPIYTKKTVTCPAAQPQPEQPTTPVVPQPEQQPTTQPVTPAPTPTTTPSRRIVHRPAPKVTGGTVTKDIAAHTWQRPEGYLARITGVFTAKNFKGSTRATVQFIDTPGKGMVVSNTKKGRYTRISKTYRNVRPGQVVHYNPHFWMTPYSYHRYVKNCVTMKVFLGGKLVLTRRACDTTFEPTYEEILDALRNENVGAHSKHLANAA